MQFLGSTPVDQAKGIDTVKDAIRRLQFAQQIKKAESGANVKIKKVEITISVDGVAVQEPRGTKILHQFPLHNISYCADEKGVKKFFSFIAKSSQTNVPNGPSNGTGDSSTASTPSPDDTHECFVFISSKLASDITLTIGQAFELAYRWVCVSPNGPPLTNLRACFRRYMTESTKPEVSKLQLQNKQLENQLASYRQRIKDLAEVLPKSELDKVLMRHGLRDILELPALENGVDAHMANINGSNTPDLGIDVSSPNNDDQLLIETSPSDKHFAPIVPPRNLLDALKPSVGTKLEGLLLNSDSDSDFDPRADENDTVPSDKTSDSFFGFEPPKTTIGQQLFASNVTATNGINGATATNGFTNGSPPLRKHRLDTIASSETLIASSFSRSAAEGVHSTEKRLRARVDQSRSVRLDAVRRAHAVEPIRRKYRTNALIESASRYRALLSHFPPSTKRDLTLGSSGSNRFFFWLQFSPSAAQY